MTRVLHTFGCFVLLSLAVTLGCSDDTPGSGSGTTTDAEIDNSQRDLNSTPDGEDADSLTGDGSLLQECESHSDCSGGYCVAAGEEAAVCAETCDSESEDECEEDGYACTEMVDPDGNFIDVCYPEETELCRPCHETNCNDDLNFCISTVDGDHCAIPCEEGGFCPVGFACELTTLPFDDEVEICVPVDNLCTECEGMDLAFDVNNCGECGRVCSVEDGAAACDQGVCVVASCEEGYDDCNSDPDDGCEVLLAENCGSCVELDGAPGAPCGLCGSGEWECKGTGGVFCVGESGDEILNECGGCFDLSVELESTCGTCGTGVWQCSSPDVVACVGDEGVAAQNNCGGCTTLETEPGGDCGTCGGSYECVGLDTVSCVGSSPTNACDGCETLDNPPGTPCGPCGDDRYVCSDEDDNATYCSGATTNGCGGCAELEAEINPLTGEGGGCGACDTGTWVCDGENAIECEGDEGEEVLNLCGGCGFLSHDPGTACGQCWWDEWVCDGTEAVSCETRDRPPADNRVDVVLPLFGEGITELTWTDDNLYVVSDDLLVPEDATLTIEPGVIVKFVQNQGPGSHADFVVEGTLIAEGTVEQPIIFTSYMDDCNGGDTNDDGTSAPDSGDWGRLRISESPDTRLDYVEIYYAGGGDVYAGSWRTITDAALSIEGSRAPALTESITVGFSRARGIRIAIDGNFPWDLGNTLVFDSGLQTGFRQESDETRRGIEIVSGGGMVTLTDVEVRDSGVEGLNISTDGWLIINRLTSDGNGGTAAVLSTPQSIDLQASTLRGRHAGADLLLINRAGTNSTVRNNTLTADLGATVDERPVLAFVPPHLAGEVVRYNTLEGAERGVWVHGGTIDTAVSWPPHLYAVRGDLEVDVSGVFTIAAGSIVKLKAGRGGSGGVDDIHLQVGGVLNLEGTEDEWVVLTSSRDDTIGGDSNLDGSDTVARAGDWSAVHFTGPGRGVLTHVELRYAGGRNDSWTQPGLGSLRIDGTTGPEIDSVRILDSVSHGLRFRPTTAFAATINDLYIDGTANSDSAIDINSTLGTIHATNVTILNSANYGIELKHVFHLDINGFSITGTADDGIDVVDVDTLVLTDGAIDQAGAHGIFVHDHSGTFTDIHVSNSDNWGIKFDAGVTCDDWVNGGGITFENNGTGDLDGCDFVVD